LTSVEDLETAPEESERLTHPDAVRGLVWVYPEPGFVALSDGKVSFGRDPSCTVRLEGPRVSRLHATIRRDAVLHVLKDEGSRNGTRRNGEAVGEVPLADDDVVRIGDWVGVVTRVPASVLSAGRLFGEPLPGVLLGPRTQLLWERVRILAPSRVPVVLVAPTGCGKEVLARAMHAESGRTGPFVAQNCAALPDSLAEAQLFGHVRGAFTGASAASPGIFGAAHGGTLLLDEIADLSLAQQAKLLRVIEERAVVPLGAVAPRPIDVRLLAATQASLAGEVDRGRFRADLLARLAGATLTIPSLAERREEAPRLFTHFFQDAGGDPGRFLASLVERLCTLDWPFNLRQLKLVAESMATFHPSGRLGAAQLEETLEQSRGMAARPTLSPPAERGSEELESEERPSLFGSRRSSWLSRNDDQARALRDAVRRHGGNVSSAARELGMSRQRAQRLLAALEEVERG
jgi:DNA-binding NtrC family response regulator